MPKIVGPDSGKHVSARRSPGAFPPLLELARAIASALVVNPFELNHGWGSSKIDRLHKSHRADPIPDESRIKRLARYARAGARTSLSAYALPAIPSDRIFFYLTTHNHRRAVESTMERLGGSALSWSSDETKAFGRTAAALSLPFFPLLVLRWFFATSYQKKACLLYPEEFWRPYGFYLASILVLRRDRPKMVVCANDHAAAPRSMFRAARLLGIPTAYIQHASVTKGFPALAHDFAFLESRHTLDCYRACGPIRSKVFLCGTPRLDRDILTTRAAVGRPRVGLCPSLFEEPELYERLLAFLAESGHGPTLTLRPHPRSPDFARYRAAAAATGSAYSDPLEETTGRFLSRHSAIVCGDSGIILEARLMGAAAVVFRRKGNTSDYYELIKRGIATAVCTTCEEVGEQLASAKTATPLVADPALKFFMETIDTPWLGRSTDLIAATLRAIVEGGSVRHMKEWACVDEPDAAQVFSPTTS